MDRRLAPDKRQLKRRLYGRTKPGTLLKHHIPLKTDHWDVTAPGFTEIDLVSHSGDSAEGEFVHSLNLTDIHTTWVETAPCWARARSACQQRAGPAAGRPCPFRLRGIDSDNGSEFINAAPLGLLPGPGDPVHPRPPVQEGRQRPHRAEELDPRPQAPGLRPLRHRPTPWRRSTRSTATSCGCFQNLFLPSVKLVRKERVGARLRRRYDAAQTPLDRVRACPAADATAVAQLTALRTRLDPFALAQTIER